MTSASSHSSSISSPLGFGQTTTMTLTTSYQQLNHSLPVKLDRTNYVLWKSQIDNIVFANGFEDFIDGTSVCPEKELSAGVINSTFITLSRKRIECRCNQFNIHYLEKTRLHNPQLDLLIPHTNYHGTDHWTHYFSVCLECIGEDLLFFFKSKNNATKA